MKITRFEEIVAWQLARELAGLVHRVSMRGACRTDFPFRDQINRAAISSMTNISEGFGRRSHPDFLRFLDISRASTRELQSLLYLGFDYEYFNDEEFREMYSLATRVAAMTTALMASIRNHSNVR